jgi:hypothetical protein
MRLLGAPGLLGDLSRAAVKTLMVYYEALAGEPLVPGIIVAVQTSGDRINFHSHLHLRRLPAKGWAAMIRKVYEVDPMTCPRCGGRMKVVAFLTKYAVVDRIIRHLELTFMAEKPPPAYAFEQVTLMAAEES